jgi:eukaryotic-like serine/threonine-protein kinase
MNPDIRHLTTLPGTASVVHGPSTTSPTFTGTRRYRCDKELGRGAFGTVYEATDRLREERVALKCLHDRSPDTLYRFKQEFRAMARIAHPNLVSLYEYEASGADCFFTMELLDGVDVLAHVGRGGRPDLPRLREALTGLVRGLRALHDAGMVHRDVKPENTLVTSSNRLVILDFGLVTSEEAAEIVGTPTYMAPEQLAGEPVTAASDWYSVGCIVHAALYGTPPHCTRNRAELLAQKRTSPRLPPAPAGAEDLAELTRRLLAPAPAERPTGDEVARLLRMESTPTTAPRRVNRPAFVGRRREVALLQSLLESATPGNPRVVLLQGPSGLGKTALAEHFLGSLKGALVVRGRCTSQELVPHKAFDGVIDALALELRSWPIASLQSLLPDDFDAAVELFPVLGGLSTAWRRPRLGQASSRRRTAYRALRLLFLNLRRAQRIVVFVDDVQWGDRDSVALLRELLLSPGAPGLLFVFGHRTDARADSPFVTELLDGREALGAAMNTIALRPLQPANARALVAELVPDATGATLDRIVSEGDGVPFLLGELARTGSERTPLPPQSVDLAGVVRRRMQELPPAARTLLETVSVAAHPLRERTALLATGSVEAARQSVHALLAGQWIRRDSSGSTIEAYHDRIREAITSARPAPRRAEIHRALAHEMAASGVADAELLFLHHRAAGDHLKAIPHALEAAFTAMSGLAYHRAAQLYGFVLEHGAESSKQQLRTKVAEALILSGRSAEAAEVLLTQAEGAAPNEAFALRRTAAELLLKSGHLERGLVVTGAILPKVGLKLQTGFVGSLISLLYHRARLWWRGLSYTPASVATADARALHRVDTGMAIAAGLAGMGTLSGAALQTQCVRLALDVGEPRQVCQALTTECMFSAIEGNLDRSRRLQQEVALLGTRASTPYQLAMEQLCAGMVAEFAAGELGESLTAYQSAQLAFEPIPGTTWERRSALFGTIDVVAAMGNYRDLHALVPDALRQAELEGDRFGFILIALSNGRFHWLSRDEPEQVRALVERAAQWFPQAGLLPHSMGILTSVSTDLYEGKFERGLERLHRHRATFA